MLNLYKGKVKKDYIKLEGSKKSLILKLDQSIDFTIIDLAHDYGKEFDKDFRIVYVLTEQTLRLRNRPIFLPFNQAKEYIKIIRINSKPVLSDNLLDKRRLLKSQGIWVTHVKVVNL